MNIPANDQTRRLLELRQNNIPRGLSNLHPIFIERAQGAWVWDLEGNAYLDFIGGIGVLNVGHNHPKIVAAVREQLEKVMHTCFQVTMYAPYIELAVKMNALAPGNFAKKTLFFTTGVEATENAIKIARAYTGRPAIISFTHSFHGRTLMGMTLTGKKGYYAQNFGPFAPEVYHTAVPYAYRGVTTQDALESLLELFRTTVDPSRVAAIILEPVLGEGGFLPVPLEFMQELRRITTQHGIVFIADEVQSGIGRTGKFFAVEHSGIEADLIPFAKSIAGGMPLSGVVGRAEIMDAPQVGGLGGTFAGNPLSCAAALAVLEVFEEENLLERGVVLGQKMRSSLEKLQKHFPQIGEVRGLGSMLAFEIVQDPHSKTPAPELASSVVEAARGLGLLLIKAGMYGSVLRLLVPLTISDADLELGLERLGTAVGMALEGILENVLENVQASSV
jgi:4-aminobutyrate aminotransferase / (S)-3-amino-2-methylpropionate transaminase / 5-aminovalerate transaminase